MPDLAGEASLEGDDAGGLQGEGGGHRAGRVAHYGHARSALQALLQLEHLQCHTRIEPTY